MSTAHPLSPEAERGLLQAAIGGDGDACLDVITLRGDRIAAVDGFATADVFARLAGPGPPLVASSVFARFGLPDSLTGDR